MSDCIFCRITLHDVSPVVIFEDGEIMAFLDRGPIRPGHTQIIAKAHIPTFEALPVPLASRILALGQALALRMKAVYAVDRVAFLFTGGDVPHVHAHVVPMHEKTDITSARYLVAPETAGWSSDHLIEDRPALERVRDQLNFVAPLAF